MIIQIIKAILTSIYILPFMLVWFVIYTAHGVYLITKCDFNPDYVINKSINKLYKDMPIIYVISTIFWIWIIKINY